MTSHSRGTLHLVFVVALAVLVARVGAAQTYETIYSFKGSPDGSDPMGGLVIAASGALFGTTFAGGTSGQGTVYELTYAKGTGWKGTGLHNFSGSPDGANPESTPAFGSTGALYGTTRVGGGEGAIFELAPPTTAGANWTETVLYGFGFTPYSQNVVPNGPVLIDKSGTLYTTTQGSPDTSGGPPLGLVLALVPPATSGSSWTEYELYIFGGNGGGASGEVPTAGVVSEAGSLFGTTEYAGNGYGTVYELTPPATNGPAWTETTIHSFAAQPGDGGGPLAPLTLGPGGVLYGTTSYGGSGSCPKTFGGGDDGCGTVVQLTPPATPGGAWTESVVYSFTGVNGDGAYPVASVAIGKNGALYGTTEYGGIATSPCPVSSYDFPGGCGTVFKLKPPSAPGDAWTETVLHDFTDANGDGASPVAPLVLSSNGAFYGTTSGGGTTGKGTIFAIAP